jgi:hypothetical protein
VRALRRAPGACSLSAVFYGPYERPLTRQEASVYSWISLAGLAATLVGVFVGILMASAARADDDEALAWIAWSGVAGIVVGAGVVGWLVGAGRPRPSARIVAWTISPGVTVGLPLLASALLNRELGSGLRTVVPLVLVSGVTADLMLRLVSRGRRTSA